jgi:AcrR family transcriptional regulator
VLLWTPGPTNTAPSPGEPAGPRTRTRARERLLAAADACYAAKGPVRTRMSDIARRAGVHRSTVYYYFAKKDTLLAASFVRVLAATAQAVDQS